jgi:tRNA(Ile)-lysidine synthase
LVNLSHKDPFLADKKIVVALSGGIDSVVLLHYLNKHYPNQIRVIHCNHHISDHANDWEDFSKKLCEKLNLDIDVLDLDIPQSNNLEEAARVKRYESLKASINIDEVICTAHHQNDQAETLLIQLLRGSGSRGLSAMPKLKTFGKGLLYRPFIDIEKSEIRGYAIENHLDWIEDDSNNDEKFTRNFLRHNILPQLEKLYPHVHKNIARASKHQSELSKISDDLAILDIESLGLLKNNRLQSDLLKQMEEYRLKNVLRYHLSQLNFRSPSEKVLEQMIQLVRAKEDSVPVVSWSHYEVRRYQDELYFLDLNQSEERESCPFYEEFSSHPKFSIGYREDGLRVKFPGKEHSQSLKKVLQEKQIPTWERDQLRMYYVDGNLVAMEKVGYISRA